MRQKRAKSYRKLMHLYSHFFGFRQPYQMLIDSETCTMAVNGKIDLVKQLGTILQGEVKPMITQCCIHELYLQGKALQPAVDLAKLFERRKCNHREPIPGDDCLADVVGETNKHRYVIVAQSQPLRMKLRSIPGVPLVHTNRSVIVLEPPSDNTLRQKALAEQKLLGTSTSDSALLEASQPDAPKKVKKKGPKGPNPLSMKKKKPAPTPKAPKPADKGKATPSQDSGAANLGKRKRLDDEPDDTVTKSENPAQSVAGVSSGVRKKKRRRSKKVSDDAVDTDLQSSLVDTNDSNS